MSIFAKHQQGREEECVFIGFVDIKLSMAECKL